MKDASERLARIEAVFHEVLAVDPELRPARLQELCGDDPLLLAEAKNLLRAAERERLTSGSKRSRQTIADAAFSQRRIGPYKLQSLLGRGGTAAVYLAQRADGQYEKTVAIKLIDVPLATELFRERFRQERQILAGLDHPLIARLLDGGVSEEGSPYLVMDYVSGMPIDQYCRQSVQSIAQRLQLFLRVCEAVQFAHQNLVVHRDLKPDNILVSDDGTPHLLDFGTAKLLSPEETGLASQSTRQGFLSFTPQYASPEQVLGQPVTIRSDIYSLGVLLFLLLTGRQPYELADFSTEEMLRVIVNLVPARPSAGATPYGPIDADLDSIVAKALRKDPSERYPTADQLVSDITAYLAGRPVLARSGDLRYRASKFARRNRIALVSALLLAFTLAAGVAGVVWEARAAIIARREADARSSDLRLLSISFLSELDDAIQQLPGSTPVRQLLVKRVTEHVDRMASDEPMDVPTQVDAADAYTRLGNLQGNPYDQNIGDPVGGLASIDRALQGLDRIRSKSPNDPALLHVYAFALQSRGEILFGIAKTRDALQASTAARDIYVRLASSPTATSLAMSEAATAEGGVADQLGKSGSNSLGEISRALAVYKSAMAWQARALAKDPDSIRARRAMPVGLLKIASVELETDPTEAVAQYRLALDALKRYPQAEQSSYAYKRMQATIERKLGMALTEIGGYGEANALFEQVRAADLGFVRADPTDARNATDLYVVEENQAECLEALISSNVPNSGKAPSRFRELAIDRLTDAIALGERNLKRNPAEINAGQATRTCNAGLAPCSSSLAITQWAGRWWLQQSTRCANSQAIHLPR